nr:Ku protein [Streptomyces sp. BR123]
MNERTGDQIDLTDSVKGYDTGDEYVLVEPKELDEIAPGRSRSLEIAGFVVLTEVDPIFSGKTYYLGPRGATYGKVCSLLEQALTKARTVGIATFVMCRHEYLLALKAENGLPRCTRCTGRMRSGIRGTRSTPCPAMRRLRTARRVPGAGWPWAAPPLWRSYVRPAARPGKSGSGPRGCPCSTPSAKRWVRRHAEGGGPPLLQ